MSKASLRDFEMLQQLGKGSFGTVHKVRRRTTQEIFVMKLISIKQLGPRGQQEAQNEVTILSSLRHPYIVQYYDSFIENKTLHILMEFCEKGDLSSVVSGQRGKLLQEAKVWKYFIQMCLGLEYIHSKNILHRDIKTLNVFLTRDESLRIGDLGVAKKLMNTAAFAHTIVGTPYYLSPELCEDKPYNIKSDIWALGCVLYELCTLKHPFEANNQAALFMKIVRAAYTQISDTYSADMKRIVSGCLSRDYRKRPSCVEILRMPGMKERALGLNILIPEDSVLSGAAVQIPQQVIEVPLMVKGALPVIIEESKESKKPADEKRAAKPSAVITPAYNREFPKPRPNPAPSPIPVVDMRLDIEAAKKQIPRSNEKAAKPLQPPVQKPAKAVIPPPKPVASPVPQKPVQVAPPVKQPQANLPVPAPVKPAAFAKPAMPPQRVIKAPVVHPSQPIARVTPTQPKDLPRPSSAVPSDLHLGTKEELEEIRRVEELPKRPSVNDLRQQPTTPKAEQVPSPVASPAASPVIKTDPWRPPVARPMSARPAPEVVRVSEEQSEDEESVDGTEVCHIQTDS